MQNVCRGVAVGCMAFAVGMVMLAGTAVASEVPLDNAIIGNGHFNLTTDDYGSFGDAFQGGPQWLDLFDPSPDPVVGELPEEFASFAAHLFFFIDPSTDGNGTHQGVLTGHAGIAATYDDGNITCEVATENSTANLPFSTDSVFTCTGPNVDFEVTLTQTVSALDAGPEGEARAMLEQEYAIKNTGVSVTELIVVRHIDEDMPWGGGTFHLDDLVGVDFAELDRPQVYAQDGDLTTAALVMRTKDNHDPDFPGAPANTVDFIYYAGKQGLTPLGNPDYPGGNCPAYDYGTDFQIWDNFGAPNCWKNNVPGVGYDVPGISPQLDGDSHIGLQVEALIVPNGTYTITYQTIYGFRPPPTLQIPPPLETQLVEYNTDTGCGEFFWRITNNNPNVPGEVFVNITEFYLDIEAGDGGDGACLDMTPPAGWTAQLCGSDNNGHSLYKFTGGTPLGQSDTANGRFTVNTNGLDPTTNPANFVEVPPLSVIMHSAQQQEDAACSFNFGPETVGNWSGRSVATAHLPVPSMSTWAKTVLAIMIIGAGAALVLRSRRPVTA